MSNDTSGSLGQYHADLRTFVKQWSASSHKYFDSTQIWFEGKEDLPKYDQRDHLLGYEKSQKLYNQLGDAIYAIQDALALKYFVKALPDIKGDECFIDVASSVRSLPYFAQFARCYYVDVKPPSPINHFAGLNIAWIKGEGQNLRHLFPPSSVPVVTSLHAPEHFGLGRYGDTIDHDGTYNFFKAANHVLQDEGTFIFSVPLSRVPRIEFHNARVYNYTILDKLTRDTGFEIEQAFTIMPTTCLMSPDHWQEINENSNNLFNPSDTDKQWNSQIPDHFMKNYNEGYYYRNTVTPQYLEAKTQGDPQELFNDGTAHWNHFSMDATKDSFPQCADMLVGEYQQLMEEASELKGRPVSHLGHWCALIVARKRAQT